MTPLTFHITARSHACRARTGLVTTPHGSFHTPAFMPVGTRGAVKGLLPHLVHDTGAEIILNNTYHLMLRPGTELIARLGGTHTFINWPHPILTDSGGYQAFSLAHTNAIDDDGVTFRSIVDGATVRLTPERSIHEQNNIGADIIMAFDDCPPSVDPFAEGTTQARAELAAARDRPRTGYDHAARLAIANERTVRWLERCKAAHARPHDQALFGIIQGGTDPAARSRSAEQICNIDLPGYAIGGVAVGERSAQIAAVVRHTAPLMPEQKPRYLMGVGYERDLYAAVRAGVDMFDCVLPTRNGRNANAFTPTGQIRLKNRRFADDPGPLVKGCDCAACRPDAMVGGGWFSRAYLRHLFMADEMLGPILVSLHNLRHFQRLMAHLRRTIAEGSWPEFERAWPVAVGAEDPGIGSGDDSGPGDPAPSVSA